jgi:hypothetical protein
MTSYKNKSYSSTLKQRAGKNLEGYYYHKQQEDRQDKLIQAWLSSNKKTKN